MMTDSEPLTRRDVLEQTARLGGVGAGIAVAGCGSTGDTGGTETGAGGAETGTTVVNKDVDWERQDTFLSNYMDGGWRDLQYNVFNPTNAGTTFSFQPGNILFDRLFEHSIYTDELHMGLADDIYVDNGDLVVEVGEGWVWHNGEEVTAEHQAIYAKLAQYMELGHERTYESPEAVRLVDDYTLRIGLQRDFTLDAIIARQLFESFAATPPFLYNEYLERFEDATSDDEIKSVQEDLVGWSLKEPIGNGPFKFVDVDETRVRFEKFEEHPNADQINFDYYEDYVHSDGVQALKEGLVHHAKRVSFPQEESVMKQMPDDLDTNTVGPGDGLLRRMMLNYQKYPTSNVKVRQAITHALDTNDIAEFTPPWITPYEIAPTGLGYFPTTQHLDHVDFELYQGGVDRATELMQEAGFEKQDGMWVDDDGPLELTLQRHVEEEDMFVIGGILKEFGFDATVEIVDTAAYVEQRSGGDIHITVTGVHEATPIGAVSQNIANPGNWRSGFLPAEVEVPMPVGNPDGDLETINTLEELDALSVAEDEDVFLNHLERLGWTMNYHVTLVHHARMLENHGYRTRWWDITPSDPGLWQTNGLLLRKGSVQAREEPPV